MRDKALKVGFWDRNNQAQVSVFNPPLWSLQTKSRMTLL